MFNDSLFIPIFISSYKSTPELPGTGCCRRSAQKISPAAGTARCSLAIVFVADYCKYRKATEATKQRFTLHSHPHAGFIGQNIYLYCASEGLSTCFVTRFNHAALAKALGLVEDQLLLYTQAVGYPAE